MQPATDVSPRAKNVQANVAVAAVASAPDEQVVAVCDTLKRPTCVDTLSVENVGPRKAANRLKVVLSTEAERREWVESARIDAILGSCPGSVESAKSGMRAWLAFFRGALCRNGNAFPPTATDLAAWSRLFRHHGTFCNYLGYVKLACELVGASTVVFSDDVVKRAKVAVHKRGIFNSRPPMFLRHRVVSRMMVLASCNDALRMTAMLCLISYVFLLRVPSECIPLVFNALGEGQQQLPLLWMNEVEGVLTLWLPRRKNKRQPSTMLRSCWCHECKETCLVHVIGAFVKGYSAGTRPFASFNIGSVLKTLRDMLMELQIPEANKYRTHDFRRGHAEDMRRNGATLGEILRAGDWRSPAFLFYLDKIQLDHDRTVEAHALGSSDDE